MKNPKSWNRATSRGPPGSQVGRSGLIISFALLTNLIERSMNKTSQEKYCNTIVTVTTSVIVDYLKRK
jgi:hypothetical protein